MILHFQAVRAELSVHTPLLFVLCNVIKPEGAAVIEKCTHTQTSSKWRENCNEKLQVNTVSYHDGLPNKIIIAHNGCSNSSRWRRKS